MDNEYKIYFDHISKSFPGVLAVDDVSFGVKKGTVHIMMGENGAGKSTLMKILNGSYQQSSGNVYIDGKPVDFSSPLDSKKAGVAMIYQELSYIPDMTVDRYLMLCREPKRFGFIDWRQVRKDAQTILTQEGLDYDVDKTMRELTVSDIQMLEITREITSNNIDVLIMDEPTSALSNKEVDVLFENIQKLKDRGITILYISHKMDEIFRIADYITVMRDGRHIITAPANEFTQDSLIKAMVGREITEVYPPKNNELGDVVLEVSNLSVKETRIADVNFYVRAGEIVGIGGLMGAGRSEVVRALFGLDKADTGEITIDGKTLKNHSVSDSINNGLVMATEDRRRYGLVLCRDILENTSLASLNKVSRYGFLNKKLERAECQNYFDQLRVKAPDMDTIVENLSGGNQQKVVLSKWLMSNAKVIILDEPTRGIDIGAKSEIYQLMISLAEQGIGIILISSELPEFIGMCDRSYIMYKGRITGELSKEEMTQESIVNLATGGVA